jgi:hypothetical protein
MSATKPFYVLKLVFVEVLASTKAQEEKTEISTLALLESLPTKQTN